MQITFLDRINEKRRRMRAIEEFILGCIYLFFLGAGVAVGGGLLVCGLSIICANV